MRLRPLWRCFGVLAAALTCNEASAGPAVSTRWAYAKQTQEQCLQRAEQTLERIGYDRLERTEQSRYGTRGDYTVAIRCITEQGIAILIASGPARGEADRRGGELLQYFGTGQK
jgi:hypothetical protein